MKLIKKIAPVFFLFSLMAFNGFAQKNFVKDADKAYNNQEYFKAIEAYKKAYTKSTDRAQKARIIFQTAECYRMINDTKQEELWYKKAIRAKYPDPKAILYLAEAKKANGKYDEALTEFNKYKAKVPSDPRGEDGAKSCELAQKWKDNPTRYQVEDMAMIDSRQSDFAPTYTNRRYNELIFTSTRPGSTGGKIDEWTGQAFSDLYETKMDRNGKWSTPVNLPAPVNTPANEGAACIDAKGRTMFFTRCNVEKNKRLNCKIFETQKRGHSWSDPVSLAFQVDSATYGHPAISHDDKTLLFSSNMAGGYGGKDLWMSTYDRRTRKWGKPTNLGPEINTKGNEMYPYLHEDGTLYFSSDGHIGMGGLDIFKAEKTGDNKWGKVTNMMYPINSPGDDFGIIFEGKKERGYFSSDREGGKGSDDIYSFVLPPLVFNLQGTVVDKDTKMPLKNAVLKLIGSDGSVAQIKTDSTGFYNFAENGKDRYIKPNTSYTITASADQYLSSGKSKATTLGVDQPKTFVQNFALQHAAQNVEIHFPKVLYDVAKATLRPESKDSLNYLYQVLIDNPNIVVELDANTDQRGGYKYNMRLSQARAQSCVDYLISKGIDSSRMVAKGYGYTRPLVTMKEINKMKTKEEKEAAYQKNRRTVFRVLRWDYVNPKDSAKAKGGAPMKHITVTGEEKDFQKSGDQTHTTGGGNGAGDKNKATKP